MGNVIIQTPRLLLRRPELGDVDRLMEIRHSEYVLKYNAMEPMPRERMLSVLEEESKGDQAFYLEERETGQLIGGLWLTEDSLRYGVNSRMLEYYLDEKYTGSGYMTEAVAAVIKYAFEVMGLKLITARVFKGNDGSEKLLERLGFVKEGVLRRCVKGYGGVIFDDMLFSLVPDEFKEPKV